MDKKAIISLVKKGISKEMVAESYGISIDEVKKICDSKKKGLTKKEKQLANELYEMGKKPSEIARALDRNYWIVQKELKKRSDYVPKASHRRLSADDKQTILRMLNLKYSVKEISKIMGIHPSNIYTLAKGNIQFQSKNSRRLTKEEQEHAIEMYNRGVKVSVIANTIEAHISSIYRLIERWKK